MPYGPHTVTVTFPGEFVVKELAGKTGVFDVEVVKVKERSVPALGDEFHQGIDPVYEGLLQASFDVEYPSCQAGLKIDPETRLVIADKAAQAEAGR